MLAWKLVLGAGIYLLLSALPSVGNLCSVHKTDLLTNIHEWAATSEKNGDLGMADRCNQLKQAQTQLSVLLLSVPFVGHVAPLLALGEELVRRGHMVSLSAPVTEGVPNKPEEMARRAGVTFMDAGPPSVVARLLVTDEAFKMWVVESEGFLSRAFRVSDLTVGENIVMASHLSNSTSDGSLLVDSLDIIIGVEYLYPLLACIQEKWNVPTVVLNTKIQQQWHTLPHWPFPLDGAQTDDLTFSQRLKNQIWGPIMYTFYKYWTIHRIKNGAKDLCHLSSIDYMLTAPSGYIPQIVPTSIGFEYPRTLSSLTEYVGPLMSHIPQMIPKLIRAWLDSKRSGSVVYIGMGSIYPITGAVARALVDGVLATNHSALWSLRKSNYDLAMQGVSDVDKNRILVVEWVPQIAVLRHRAVGLAILHGGMSGLHEALSAGIPAILIPLSSDQFSNSFRVQHSEAGIVLDFRSISPDKIMESIIRLNSMEYREAAQKMSRIFKQAGGAERAANLVELYADIGYTHLIPAYVKYHWSWVQFYNIDVFATLLISVGLVFSVLVFAGGKLFCLIAAPSYKPKAD